MVPITIKLPISMSSLLGVGSSQAFAFNSAGGAGAEGAAAVALASDLRKLMRIIIIRVHWPAAGRSRHV